MDVYALIKEKYLMGGKTHAELAQEYGVPVGSIRRKAAAEGWKKLRAQRMGVSEMDDETAKQMRIARQLEITDRLLDIIAKALENPDELFAHIECRKTGGDIELVCEKTPYLNDVRLVQLVKALGDIFEYQRLALCIPEFKERHDAQFADRKLDIELLKLENAAKSVSSVGDDGFLEALGIGLVSEGADFDIDSV